MASQMTRAQALTLIWPLIYRVIQNEYDEFDDDLEAKLTEEMVTMLPPSTKLWLHEWAKQTDRSGVLERLHRCIEDKSMYLIETLLDDLHELSIHPQLSEDMARQDMKAAVSTLRHYSHKNRRIHDAARDVVIRRISAVQSTTSIIKEAIEEVYIQAGSMDKANALQSIMNNISLVIEEMGKIKKSIR